MEEIDNIITHSLRQIGCEIDENSTLSKWDPAVVVKCVSRCLRCIDPSLELPEKMPAGMAQKYGVTLALAEKCSDIGFRGDIGYQTFLYSNNVIELRRVLMFLIDRLPKDESDGSGVSKELTEKERIHLALCKNLSVSLKSRKSTLPLLDRPRVVFTAATGMDRNRSVLSQTNPGNLWATLITQNDSQSSSDRRGDPFRTNKNKIGLNGSSSVNSISVAIDSEPVQESERAVEEEPKECPVEQMRTSIDSLRGSIEEKRQERVQLAQRLQEMKKKLQLGNEKLEDLKTEKKIKERTLLVLENPQENVQKLQRMIENSGEKMKRLQDQWLEHKTPLQLQLDEINEKRAAESSKTKVIEEQILEAKQKQNTIRSEGSVKAEQYAQFMSELEKVNQKIDRSAYTSRILEIIGNIRKQKTDIDKILRDTREVQKDINSVTGKLERQFTITDDLLFGHAKRDEQTKRAYKLFLKAHSDCGELAKSIQETGKVSRELRDLEEQIENSRSRNTASNLQQVSRDLEEMCAENDKLFLEIQGL